MYIEPFYLKNKLSPHVDDNFRLLICKLLVTFPISQSVTTGDINRDLLPSQYFEI